MPKWTSAAFGLLIGVSTATYAQQDNSQEPVLAVDLALHALNCQPDMLDRPHLQGAFYIRAHPADVLNLGKDLNNESLRVKKPQDKKICLYAAEEVYTQTIGRLTDVQDKCTRRHDDFPTVRTAEIDQLLIVAYIGITRVYINFAELCDILPALKCGASCEV